MTLPDNYFCYKLFMTTYGSQYEFVAMFRLQLWMHVY